MESTFVDMVARTRDRIAHLQTERDKLDAEWRRIPRLAVWLVLTIPAGLLWGFGAVVMVVVATIGLLVTGAYIIGVRRASTNAELRDLARELRAFEVEAGRS